MPPGHPCLFPFPILFLVFPFPFAVLRFSLPFRVVVYVYFLYRLLRSFLFASLLSWVADSVILSRYYTPPALLASLQVCVFPLCAAFFLAFLLLFVLFFFPSFPFFDFDLDVVCFIRLFLAGIVFSPRFRFLLRVVYIAHDTYLIHTCIRTLISPFYFVRYTICFSYFVYSIFFLLFFFVSSLPEVTLHSRVIVACPVTTDCIVAMS